MSDESGVVLAPLVALLAVWALTPGVIRIARRTGFLDQPKGYKAHGEPTPYLGGVAVLGGVVAGMLAAGLAFGTGLGRFVPAVACALALGVLGILDDRVTVRPLHRVAAEVTAAGVIVATGLGWDFLASDFEQFLLTAVWIVGFTNAFNLMDNMDGAAGTVGAVCAGGIAVAALAGGDSALATFALAIGGACLGFLRFNLRRGRRARIFLGDGGSMPLGFLIAVAAMQIPPDENVGWPILLGAGLMLGVLVLDTLLVVVSRTRRGVAVVTAGRDHLTHRLYARLGSPVAVAVALAATQAGVSALGVAAIQVGRTSMIASALACITIAALLIAILDSPAWAPPQEQIAS